MTHNCRVCGIELTNDNWYPSYKLNRMYVCKTCEYHRQKQHLSQHTEDLPFCECGCGERVKRKGSRFIMNHDKRTPAPKRCLCECGCGGLANPKRRFIKGHHANGESNPMYGMSGEKSPVYERKHTEEEKKIISAANSGENNSNFGKSLPEKTKKKISAGLKGGSVLHHYIYDHSNPELYTTKITRVKHNQIHGQMRRAGIVTPHINMNEDNKDIFKRG